MKKFLVVLVDSDKRIILKRSVATTSFMPSMKLESHSPRNVSTDPL